MFISLDSRVLMHLSAGRIIGIWLNNAMPFGPSGPRRTKDNRPMDQLVAPRRASST